MERMTVRLVRDHEPTRHAYATFLSECGYRVVEAGHGGEAILHADRQVPDVMLLDLAMPAVNGIGAAESLRRRPRTARTRIIGVTGCGDGPERERMQRLCDDLLAKPRTPAMVDALIRRLTEAAE